MLKDRIDRTQQYLNCCLLRVKFDPHLHLGFTLLAGVKKLECFREETFFQIHSNTKH